MLQLLEAGVHYGHHKRRWNPKMARYIYGVRNNIHIIDLQQTVPHLHAALQQVKEVASRGGRILFVGTKRQASDVVAEFAKKCGQYYVNHRWLGGMLTNWKTVSQSIARLVDLEKKLEDQDSLGFTKKEILSLQREYDKLSLELGGIRDMGGRPDLIFLIDAFKEQIAIKEAGKLGIPVVAIVDTNSSPDGIQFVVPGNDDATRAVRLYCELVSKATLAGLKEEMAAAGVDLGAAAEVSDEALEGLPEVQGNAGMATGDLNQPTAAAAESQKIETE